MTCGIDISNRGAAAKYCLSCYHLQELKHSQKYREVHHLRARISAERTKIKRREAHRAYNNAWRLRNHDFVVAGRRRRYARWRIPVRDQILFRRVLHTWFDACFYCGATHVPLVIDHVVPVCLGGSKGIANQVLTCKACNDSKGAKTVQDWYDWKEKVLAHAKGDIV